LGASQRGAEVHAEWRVEQAGGGAQAGVADGGAVVGVGPAAEIVVGEGEGAELRTRLVVGAGEDVVDLVL